MYYYEVTEAEDPLIQRTAYGIVGEDGRGHSTAVENISCDREFVARLAERCTRGSCRRSTSWMWSRTRCCNT